MFATIFDAAPRSGTICTGGTAEDGEGTAFAAGAILTEVTGVGVAPGAFVAIGAVAAGAAALYGTSSAAGT